MGCVLACACAADELAQAGHARGTADAAPSARLGVFTSRNCYAMTAEPTGASAANECAQAGRAEGAADAGLQCEAECFHKQKCHALTAALISADAAHERAQAGRPEGAADAPQQQVAQDCPNGNLEAMLQLLASLTGPFTSLCRGPAAKACLRQCCP